MKRAAVPSILLAVVLLALGVIAEAQQPAKVPKIGWLGARSASAPMRELFRREIGAFGYVEGKNVAFEYRYAEGKLDRLPALADELVRLKVDVLIAPATPAAVAAKNATRTIPIVFYAGYDPVAWVGRQSRAAWGKRHGFHHDFDGVARQTTGVAQGNRSKALPHRGIVGSRRTSLDASLERKPTPGTRIGSGPLFHEGKPRRQIRGCVQRRNQEG